MNDVETLRSALSPHIEGLSDAPVNLAAALDELPLGVAILGPDLSVRMLNRALEGLTGFTTEEVRGVHCRHVLRASHCPVKCPLRATPLGAEADASEDAQLPASEGDILNRHRRRIPVRMTLSRLRDAQGRTAGWLHAVEDLTQVKELEAKRAQGEGFGQLVGRSLTMERIFQALPAIAGADAPLLITGETGAGKDAVAEAVHKASKRGREPFVKASLSALPEFLAESELFGHRKGAFPGAEENKPGRFRLAQGGTLFITEIGDLSPAIQGRLLTFLDEGVIYPVGATEPVRLDVRLMAATNRAPEELAAEGGLREDLHRRLAAVRLHLPPLRERGEDVEFLLDHFLRFFAARLKKPVRAFSGRSLRTLIAYAWPGNVRELKNVVEYAATLCPGETIMPAHLPAYLFHGPGSVVRQPAHASAPVERQVQGAGQSLEDIERRMIEDALVKARGRRGEAATILGWGRSTLWRKMKHYEMI